MSKNHKVHCDCGTIEITMTGAPRIHAFCHCEDCRALLNVPYHSIVAWDANKLKITKGSDCTTEYKHPTLEMSRVFCQNCGETLYNTNAMGWKLVSQLLVQKCNHGELPKGFESEAHYFYDRRIVEINDGIPKG